MGGVEGRKESGREIKQLYFNKKLGGQGEEPPGRQLRKA